MSAEAAYAVRASPLVGSSVGGEGGEGRQSPKVNDLEDGPFYHRSVGRTLYIFVRAVGSRPPAHSGVSSENRSHLSLFENRRKKRRGTDCECGHG